MKKQGKRERRTDAKPGQLNPDASADSMVAEQSSSLLMYKRASGKPLLCSASLLNETAPLPLANDDLVTQRKKTEKMKKKKKKDDD